MMHAGLSEIIAIAVHMGPLDSQLWSGMMSSYFTSRGAQECTCVALACNIPAGLARRIRELSSLWLACLGSLNSWKLFSELFKYLVQSLVVGSFTCRGSLGIYFG